MWKYAVIGMSVMLVACGGGGSDTTSEAGADVDGTEVSVSDDDVADAGGEGEGEGDSDASITSPIPESLTTLDSGLPTPSYCTDAPLGFIIGDWSGTLTPGVNGETFCSYDVVMEVERFVDASCRFEGTLEIAVTQGSSVAGVSCEEFDDPININGTFPALLGLLAESGEDDETFVLVGDIATPVLTTLGPVEGDPVLSAGDNDDNTFAIPGAFIFDFSPEGTLSDTLGFGVLINESL